MKEKLLCEIIALNAKGERKIFKIACYSFYEVYGELRKKGLRLITYTILS